MSINWWWIYEMWYIHTVEYRSSIKGMKYQKTWKHYVKRKKPDAVGHILCSSIYKKCPEWAKAETENQLVSCCQGLGLLVGNWGVTANEYGFSFWDDDNVLGLDNGDVC